MSIGIVLLGGNKLAFPAISHITSLGFHTIVVDQFVSRELKKICSETIQVNFSNAKNLIEALKNKSFKAIIPLNDFAVMSAAISNVHFNLVGYSIKAAKNVTEKFRLKNCWIKSGLKTPYSLNIQKENYKSVIEKWEFYPCILKPSFAGGGSRDVLYAKNFEQLKNNYKLIKNKYKNILLEEFIDGSEHSAEVLICNENIHIISVSDKSNYPFSNTVVQNLQFPGEVGMSKIESLKKIFWFACKSLGIQYGTAHFEFIIDRKNEVYLLEVGGRPGGGLNFFPISFISNGIDYPKLLIEILVNQNIKKYNLSIRNKLCWHFFDIYNGKLSEIIGLNELLLHEDVIEADIFVNPGDYRNGGLKNDMERTGYVLFKYDDISDMGHKINLFDNLITFKVDT